MVPKSVRFNLILPFNRLILIQSATVIQGINISTHRFIIPLITIFGKINSFNNPEILRKVREDQLDTRKQR